MLCTPTLTRWRYLWIPDRAIAADPLLCKRVGANSVSWWSTPHCWRFSNRRRLHLRHRCNHWSPIRTHRSHWSRVVCACTAAAAFSFRWNDFHWIVSCAISPAGKAVNRRHHSMPVHPSQVWCLWNRTHRAECEQCTALSFGPLQFRPTPSQRHDLVSN